METVNEPRYVLIPVTILDIIFIGGHAETLTLYEADTYAWLDGVLYVTIANQKDPSKTSESIRYFPANMLAFKVREASVRKVDKRPIPPFVDPVIDDRPAD